MVSGGSTSINSCTASQTDGSYTMRSGEAGPGAAVGTHKISVLPPEPQSFGDAPQPTNISIPMKYQEADSSGLEVTVPKGGTVHNIELSSD